MTPTIGALRKRIRIEQPIRTSDGIGGSTVSWQLVATVWASLEPLAGNEAIDAQRVAGSVSHQCWMRFRTGVTADMRLMMGTRGFDIRMVIDHQERHRYLRLMAEERL